ncbi:hypothetical protein L3Y34_006711 [Caenorhabditis briggsae]|uniref:Uncharacterized protein n=1 Tax=Caenorhabditis briggsae TaxID=6238 RepID=A0AAE9A033_CAEBR|nr:hypothetical protein L3Y34_006711 [Caenorhabditis briggsae]
MILENYDKIIKTEYVKCSSDRGHRDAANYKLRRSTAFVSESYDKIKRDRSVSQRLISSKFYFSNNYIDNYRHPLNETAEKIFIVTGKDDWKRPFVWERIIFDVQTRVVRFGCSLMLCMNRLNKIIATFTDSWRITKKQFSIEYHKASFVLLFMKETQNMETAESNVLKDKGFLLLIPDQKGLKEKVFRMLPCLPHYIYKEPILVVTENYTYHFIVSCSFIIIYTIEGTILSGSVILTTIKQLKTRKMSPKAFQTQKSTFIALLTQMLVPLVMIITPCTYGWASLVVNYHNQALMNFAMITGSLHGALSTIIMITVHRSYREAVQDVFKGSSRRETTNDHRKYLFVVINY